VCGYSLYPDGTRELELLLAHGGVVEDALWRGEQHRHHAVGARVGSGERDRTGMGMAVALRRYVVRVV